MSTGGTPIDAEAAGAEPGPAPTLRERLRRANPRFRSENRRELKYRLSILVATVASWIVGRLPDRLRNRIADRIGSLWIRLVPAYRANVVANVGQVVGPEVSLAEKQAIAHRIFQASARNFGDLLRLPHLDRDALARMVPLVAGDWAYLDEPLAAGRGVVLVTAHLGAFDVVGHAIAARGYPLTTVTGRTTTRFLFDAVTHLRRSGAMEVVEATPAGIRKVILALRRGELAAFLADFDFFQNGLPVTFFGRPTTLPPGPIRIARDTGAVVVGAFARRLGDAYSLSLEPPFEIPKTRDLDADLAAGMARLVALLERAIGASPEQWVMFQRVWPLAPPDPFRVFPVGSPLESEFLKRVDEVLPPRRGS